MTGNHPVARAGLYVLVSIVAAAVASDLYARIPARFDPRPLDLGPGVRHLVLIFHGRGGAADPGTQALAARFQALAGGQTDVAVIRYVWSPHSDTRFRSAVNGARVGGLLGGELAQLPGLRSVHLVGHSAGAYPADAACGALRAGGRRDLRVEMTFLDPIGFAGMFDTGSGARNFGQCADYAEAYINTDDPVPATGEPLRHAWNVDVTRSPERAGYDGGGHRWPVQYYIDHLSAADLAPERSHDDSRPRGAVERR